MSQGWSLLMPFSGACVQELYLFQFFLLIQCRYVVNPECASIMVNPVEPIVYYDPSGTIASISSTIQPSNVYAGSGTSKYAHTAASDQSESHQGNGKSEYSSLPVINAELDVSTSGKSDIPALQIPPSTTTVQAAATVTLKDDEPATSTTVTAPAALSTAAFKAQTKVVRSKRKTVAVATILRSNKKVSSLVDKWKDAKEELHEDDEDEPENAYEMLEKKKQREIEEWRPRQIASGEAKDNANFQPLGGDWYGSLMFLDIHLRQFVTIIQFAAGI